MNENIVGNRNRGEFYECITVHDSNDTVFVERQLMARTNFTNAFLSFSITRGIEEQAVFPEMQLVTYEGYFSLSSEITNSGAVFTTGLSMETILTISSVASAPYAIFNIQIAFINEKVINYLGFASVPLGHFVNIAIVINEDVFDRNVRHGNRSSRITNSEAALPTTQLTIEATVTMPNVISALCVLSNVQTVFTHEQVTRYSEYTSVVIEIQLRHLMVMVNEDVLNRIRGCINRPSETDANNMETVFSEEQITRYGGNTTVF